MRIVIEAEAKEIAALVLAVQERQGMVNDLDEVVEKVKTRGFSQAKNHRRMLGENLDGSITVELRFEESGDQKEGTACCK